MRPCILAKLIFVHLLFQCQDEPNKAYSSTSKNKSQTIIIIATDIKTSKLINHLTGYIQGVTDCHVVFDEAGDQSIHDFVWSHSVD